MSNIECFGDTSGNFVWWQWTICKEVKNH